jgi:hypothetical protein
LFIATIKLERGKDMWQLVISITFISLLVERFLELFDALVVLNLFPWWRSAPSPPPTKPHDSKSEEADEEGEEIHRQRLVYYIAKYGYFLRIGWLGRLVEDRLAQAEGASQFPGGEEDKEFAKKIAVNGQLPQTRGESPKNLTPKLELWADYCYLRDQRTHEAFSIVKGQLYFVLGALCGLWIANLLNIYNFWLGSSSGLTPTAYLGGSSGLLGIQFGFPFNDGLTNSLFGAGIGMGSQPMHWIFRRLAPYHYFIPNGSGPIPTPGPPYHP